MVSQLYDLFRAPVEGTEDNSAFLLRAPMSTLVEFLSLRKEAVARIERETKEAGAMCELFSPRDSEWIHIVVRATMVLGTER